MRHRHLSTCCLLLAAALFFGGCGEPTLIILQISGDLIIPDDINSLTVAVLSDPDHDDLNRFTLNLRQEDALPITVSLEPSESTPSKLIVNVTAALESQIVAHSESKFEWFRNKVNQVSLPALVLSQGG